MRVQLEQFGWHVLANYVVRNADCHAKNIALYYTRLGDVGFTPAYDIVTTQAYPRYANNPPGLSIDGRQTWAAGKALQRFEAWMPRLARPASQSQSLRNRAA